MAEVTEKGEGEGEWKNANKFLKKDTEEEESESEGICQLKNSLEDQNFCGALA